MITMHVHRKEGYIIAIELNGHANSGPYGYDLVCAGVSAVTFGAVNAIEVITKVSLDIAQGEDDGYLKVKCPIDQEQKETFERIQLLLEGMLVALRTIEATYGEHIKIMDEGGV